MKAEIKHSDVVEYFQVISVSLSSLASENDLPVIAFLYAMAAQEATSILDGKTGDLMGANSSPT